MLKPVAYATLAGLLGGGVGAYVVANRVVPKIVERELVSPSSKIIIEGQDIPANSFSAKEKVKVHPLSYWKSKTNFKLDVDNTEERIEEGEEKRYGQSFRFFISEYGAHGETLYIANYTGPRFATSDVFLFDDNHDGKLDTISIEDKLHETKRTIIRSRADELMSDALDEKSIRQLYDLYMARFHRFKEQHDVDQKLRDYQEPFEIREIEIR